MGIVLDSSLFIGDERGYFSLDRFIDEACGSEPTYITSVIASELLHGYERANPGKRKTARKEYIEYVFARTPILDFDLRTARIHANLWANLAANGQVINDHDMLIHDMLIAASCKLHPAWS